MPIFTKNNKILKNAFYSPIVITNGGGQGTTDWVDSNSDGLADTWAKGIAANVSASIVTGNGFTGNAQKMQCINTGTVAGLRSNVWGTFTSGKTYKLSFKYRTNVNNIFRVLSGAVNLISYLPINTGNCLYVEYIFTDTTGGDLNFYTSLSSTSGDWLEIDEINVLEIKYHILKVPDIPRNGLINEWLFDGLDTLKDTGSLANNLVINGGGTISDILVRDKNSFMAAFQSNADAKTISPTATFQIPKGYSVNWWQFVPAGQILYIFYQAAGGIRYIRTLAATKAIEYRAISGTTSSVACANFLASSWQNITVNYGASTMDVYINGIYQGSSSNSDHVGNFNVEYIAYIAALSTGTKVDSIRIYNRLLSEKEIIQIYTNSL